MDFIMDDSRLLSISLSKKKNLNEKNINIDLQKIKPYFGAAISVDCVIFGFDGTELKVLLMRCNMDPYIGQWSLIGDLLRVNENLKGAAKRILYKRTGLKDMYLEQIKAFGKVDRHPLGRVITVAYYSLVKISEYELDNAPEYREAHWHNISDITELAFDHLVILDECLKLLRKHVKEAPVGFNLLPHKFTLPQLQNLYENLLGKTLDKRNFRKKMLKMKILKDIGETQQNVSHRPGKLYSFDQERYDRLKKDGFIFEIN